ncbi:MAG TPA: phosphate acyltransferase, partial [Thermopetrobacter sp.]|nr:phosphate acyltransferase [Thermopetrobacter sp.]
MEIGPRGEARGKQVTKGYVIAVDAMGGDHGPEVTVPGIDMVLARHPNMRVLMFGQ